MGTEFQNKCFRCRTDCTPISNIQADEGIGSFICVGYNRQADRAVKKDRFTLCWKNAVVDERGHWDRRDMLDTVATISHALSIDENIRVNNEFTDDQMNEVDLL